LNTVYKGELFDPDGIDLISVVSKETEPCNLVSDFRQNETVFTVSIIAIVIIGVCTLACLGVCCRYRRLRSQYYERLSLIKGDSSQQPSELSTSSRAAKRQIVYQMNEE
jgi:hypothetical protein